MRSRERILDTARGRDVAELRLNDLAREAGVGVATVYRHFPTVRALIEALSVDALRRLGEAADAAVGGSDPLADLRAFLAEALAQQLDQSGLQTVLADLALLDAHTHSECTAARADVHAGYERVLARAQAAGIVRPDLTALQLQSLVSGVEHAVRLARKDPDRDDRALLLDILITGIRA